MRYAANILLVSVLLLALITPASGADQSSQDQVRRWQVDKTPFYLVDVRSPALFGRKHIAGAINIPAFVVHRKGLPKDVPLVVYDGGLGSQEATAAAERLGAAGYGKVSVLTGGLAGWEASRLPIQAQQGVLDIGLVEQIMATDLARLMASGSVLHLVDLRPAADFRAGSIPGARHATPATLAGMAAAWPVDEPIVLFDAGNGEAERQAEQLRRAGFRTIRVLYGGYPAWLRRDAA